MASRNDVLPGRGHGRRPGDQYWIKLVTDNLEEYDQANKADKETKTALIVVEVQNQGGRFLEHDGHDSYLEISNKEPVLKTRQCFINLKKRLTGRPTADAPSVG